tara:strand:- start:669 stop:914 length:246 start_codon:yes stop_codon:yes gene_type:complete
MGAHILSAALAVPDHRLRLRRDPMAVVPAAPATVDPLEEPLVARAADRYQAAVVAASQGSLPDPGIPAHVKAYCILLGLLI